MSEAQEVDRILAGEVVPPEYSLERKPFLGIPCTIKESQSLFGMPHTRGLVKRKGTTATTDAPVVQRVRDAGAIVIAMTTVVNCVCGMRRAIMFNNPYNTDCMVGGSSGGEESINGAACSMFSIGSDIGGSVCMPCFFCGIFGHKHSSSFLQRLVMLKPI